MKRKHKALVAAAMLAVSSQVALADTDQMIWAGHFKDGYSAGSQQTQGLATSGTRTSYKDALVWSGQFVRAYEPAPPGAAVAISSTGRDSSEHLLWAVHFKPIYAPARDEAEVVEKIGEVAINQN